MTELWTAAGAGFFAGMIMGAILVVAITRALDRRERQYFVRKHGASPEDLAKRHGTV